MAEQQTQALARTAGLPASAQLNGQLRASAIEKLASNFGIESSKVLEILKGTVIKPDKDGRQATTEEVAAFIIVCNQYGLNPFVREIYAFVGRGGAVVPIVGIDGWVSLVNRHPQFDGCEFEEE